MRDLNATSAALLGLLHDGPRTGGQLVAVAGERFGSFFSVTRSQVYRELPVLTEAGLLRLGKRGVRASQQYVITAAGKPNDQRPATAYVFRDGNLRRVPFDGDCWQADW